MGIAWAFDVVPGNRAGAAIALWDKSAYGRTGEIRMLVRSVFRAHNLHRMYALVAARNTSAHHLLERLGFQQEGLQRDGMCYRGVWDDTVLYGMLADEVT